MPVPAIAGIGHVALTVTDVERSVAWYQETLGLQRIARSPHPGGFGVFLRTPDEQLWVVLHHHDDNGGERFAETRTGLDHVGFRVPSMADLKAWQERFAEREVVHSPITELPDWGVAVLVFRDPDNVQLELFAVVE
jgi:glyoxylase I family protein